VRQSVYDQETVVDDFAPIGTIVPFSMTSDEPVPKGWEIKRWPPVVIVDDVGLNPYQPDVARIVMLVKV
jgi:hypothetical protein